MIARLDLIGLLFWPSLCLLNGFQSDQIQLNHIRFDWIRIKTWMSLNDVLTVSMSSEWISIRLKWDINQIWFDWIRIKTWMRL